MVFAKLLGPEFDITKLKNGTLLFNLACYYALHNEKKLMLIAIQQALKNGKKADEFKTDSDLKQYWDDADFLNALSAESKD